jgi:hypothetical protein
MVFGHEVGPVAGAPEPRAPPPRGPGRGGRIRAETKENDDVSKRGGNKTRRPTKPPMANKGPKAK